VAGSIDLEVPQATLIRLFEVPQAQPVRRDAMGALRRYGALFARAFQPCLATRIALQRQLCCQGAVAVSVIACATEQALQAVAIAMAVNERKKNRLIDIVASWLMESF